MIKQVLYKVLKPQIEHHRIRKEISWEELFHIAVKKDFLKKPIIYTNKKRIEIRCHTHPSYDSDEPINSDEWNSLFCVIENNIITDTYLLENRYKNVTVTDIKSIRYSGYDY